jgi:hypothetical protein
MREWSNGAGAAFSQRGNQLAHGFVNPLLWQTTVTQDQPGRRRHELRRIGARAVNADGSTPRRVQNASLVNLTRQLDHQVQPGGHTEKPQPRTMLVERGDQRIAPAAVGAEPLQPQCQHEAGGTHADNQDLAGGRRRHIRRRRPARRAHGAPMTKTGFFIRACIVGSCSGLSCRRGLARLRLTAHFVSKKPAMRRSLPSRTIPKSTPAISVAPVASSASNENRTKRSCRMSTGLVRRTTAPGHAD